MFARDERDFNSLMLLGPQPIRHRGYPGPYPTTRSFPAHQPTQQQVLGPCFECNGPHLVKYCPHRKQMSKTNQGVSTIAPPRIPPLERYCLGCSVEHFPKDCLLKPAEPSTPKNPATLNIVSVIPSPATSENESDIVSLKVITRAQHKNTQIQMQETNPRAETSMIKPQDARKSLRKRTRSKRGKKSKEKSSSDEEIPTENPIPKELEGVLRPKRDDPKMQTIPKESEPAQKEQVSDSEKNSGGSVLVEKVNEPLDAALQAYESRLTPLTKLPKKLQEYPNPRAEKINLVVHQ